MHQDNKQGRGLFFNLSALYSSKELRNNTSHINVISLLCSDLHCRKGYSLERLPEELVKFLECQDPQENALQNEVFIYSMLTFVCSLQSNECSYFVQELLRLIWKNTRNFQRLFSELCNPGKNVSEAKFQNTLNKMEYIFRNGVKVRTQEGWHRVVDTPLVYGERPLMLAARHKQPDATLLLLRHGAEVHTTWLHFQSAVEVLLFAPNQTVLGPQAEILISHCIRLFLRAVNLIDRGRLKDLEEEGYYPLLDSWKDVIPTCYSESPRSLRHLCKLLIRNCLLESNNLPTGIYQLPVPTPMKDYLDLLRD